MHLPPPLQKHLSDFARIAVERARQLTRKQQAIAAGAAVLVLVVLPVLIFSGSDEKPAPHVFTQPVQAPAKPQTTADQSALILQLFNPSDQSLQNQLSTTVISQQIEQALTVSFVLTKCGTISQDDYTDTFRALILYAQQTKLSPDAVAAEARVRELADTAGASYAMIYSRTPCTDPSLPVLAKQLGEWVDAVFKR